MIEPMQSSSEKAAVEYESTFLELNSAHQIKTRYNTNNLLCTSKTYIVKQLTKSSSVSGFWSEETQYITADQLVCVLDIIYVHIL